jgi:hypothetical protein
MYKNCLCIKSTVLQKQKFLKQPMLQNYFSHSSCCVFLLFYPPISQLPGTAGCLKSQYQGVNFTVLRCSVIMVYNSLTGNTTHHMERQVLFFICSEKTKLKQICSTATATSQNSVLLTFSDHVVVYYKNFWFCNLLHTLLFPKLQTGTFPSALVCNSILPTGRETNLPTHRK